MSKICDAGRPSPFPPFTHRRSKKPIARPDLRVCHVIGGRRYRAWTHGQLRQPEALQRPFRYPQAPFWSRKRRSPTRKPSPKIRRLAEPTRPCKGDRLFRERSASRYTRLLPVWDLRSMRQALVRQPRPFSNRSVWLPKPAGWIDTLVGISSLVRPVISKRRFRARTKNAGRATVDATRKYGGNGRFLCITAIRFHNWPTGYPHIGCGLA